MGIGHCIKIILFDPMDVNKAREILSNSIKHLSDEEVEELIKRSSALIEIILDMYEEKYLKEYVYKK